MAYPMISPLRTCPGTAVIAAATSTLILAANEDRSYASFINDSDEICYLAFGEAAVLHSGVRINAAGGSYEINATNLNKLAVYAISTSGAKNIVVMEGV